MKHKTALITGAALRVGAAITRYLHKQDIDVVVHYNKSGAAVRKLVSALNAIRPDSALAVQADLSTDCDYASLIEASLGLNERLDVLINNASTFYPTPVDEISEKHWRELVDTNLKAPLFLCQAAVPQLQETGGCIVNITDIHGTRPLKDHPLYSITKAGLIMLTRALAKELAPAIRVNAVSPGAILWPKTMSEDTRADIVQRIPLKKQGEPVDIAKAVHFLVADADYMTGQILDVDGGRNLYG
ncbi:MAG: pteridine reductase [Gammaproteobacteria bacterium]